MMYLEGNKDRGDTRGYIYKYKLDKNVSVSFSV